MSLGACEPSSIIDWDSITLQRYIGDNEFSFIRSNGYVKSTNPRGTYWTNLLTNDPICAKVLLGLKYEVKYRISSIPKTILKDLPSDIYEINHITIPETGFINYPGFTSLKVIEVIIRKPLNPNSIYDMDNGTLLN
ncbi:hypothetical protein [Sulfurisphaera tokodaii]|uniref:Uncharacterized protein n=2 Tax=Sulfurisphaera tokodaii TaxID=111955 RepID=Q972Y8_SULTO|nr:hypothetical protein [Sulfurisphaera tokodaii]BAB66025.1 hypothetical protein STK_10010 [Sulfurisphaera tokodaii str. 7]HII73987.1 hypothetical protein [Sulfurisphaera tokodaii]